jgi:hypothetical protein
MTQSSDTLVLLVAVVTPGVESNCLRGRHSIAALVGRARALVLGVPLRAAIPNQHVPVGVFIDLWIFQSYADH